MWLFNYFDWVVSLTTLCCMELMIRQKWYAWIAGLLNQFIWLVFIISNDKYGLLPLNILMFIQNTRGLLNWSRIRRNAAQCNESHVPPS